MGDFYISHRRNPHDDFGWGPPEPIHALNTPDDEYGPWGFTDPHTGALTLYFNSNRPGGLGSHDIYSSTQQSDGTFSTPALEAGLSSSSADLWPVVTPDGLEFFLTSNRPGGMGGTDIWVSSRGSLGDAWSPPVNAGPAINTASAEQRSAITPDGRRMVFFSNRPGGAGGFDLWETTRRSGTLVPVAGSVTGAFGTTFRTAARLTNPTDRPISGNLLFRPAGAEPSSSDPILAYTLSAFETVTFADLFARFGVSGIGSLEVLPSEGSRPIIDVRIENGGTVAVPTAGEENLLRGGSRGILALPDLTRFRYNIGVRTLAPGARITFQLHDAAGTMIRSMERVYPPNYFVQVPAAQLFGTELGNGQTVVVRVDSGSAVVYGSAVPNSGSGATLHLAQRSNDD
jgi:hypothetical protein